MTPNEYLKFKEEYEQAIIDAKNSVETPENLRPAVKDDFVKGAIVWFQRKIGPPPKWDWCVCRCLDGDDWFIAGNGASAPIKYFYVEDNQK